jgi:uncharacterized protein (DUF1684 family)
MCSTTLPNIVLLALLVSSASAADDRLDGAESSGLGQACALERVADLERNWSQKAVTTQRRMADQIFRDPVRSPLLPDDRERFDGLNYYPVRSEFLLRAAFHPAGGERVFDLPTFNGELQRYSEFGQLIFCAPDGETSQLTVFQRQDQGAVGKLTVIVPFRDLSNGNGTYTGGRYLKFLLPLPQPLLIDFNRSVNPYCAYNPTLPCPIPPRSNWLSFEVPAGEKAYNAAD